MRSKSAVLRWMAKASPVWMMCLTCACTPVRTAEVSPASGKAPSPGQANASSAGSGPAEASPPDALTAVAQYTGGKHVKADALIRKLGYVPRMAEGTWSNLPALRQIEIAYRSADAFDSDRGGQFFLAALCRDLAPHYETARNEPGLARYFKLATLLGTFQFKEPSGAQAQAPLPPEIQEVIRLFAEYASRSPLGSQHQILVSYFHLSNDAAFELFTGTRSYGQVLAAALAKVDAAQQKDAMRSLVTAVATHHEAARREPSFQTFLAGWSPPAGGAPAEPAKGPGAGANSPVSAGIVRIENPGSVAFDFYLNHKLLGRIGLGVTVSFSVLPGSHAIEWRETDLNSPFSDPQTLQVTAGNVHTLKAPRILTCTRSCAAGQCGPWECPPGLTPPPP
jgi:hypothetical protein